jgi:hypothetical protein
VAARKLFEKIFIGGCSIANALIDMFWPQNRQ